MNWYTQVLKKYAVFEGRATRKEYWMFVLINLLVAFAIGFITGLIGGARLSGTANLLYSLAVFLPSVAVGVRRLHDSGRSGWWLLLPLVNVVLLCLAGESGSNEYGPPARPLMARAETA